MMPAFFLSFRPSFHCTRRSILLFAARAVSAFGPRLPPDTPQPRLQCHIVKIYLHRTLLISNRTGTSYLAVRHPTVRLR